MSSIEQAPPTFVAVVKPGRVPVPQPAHGARDLLLLSWAAPLLLVLVWEALARFGGLSPHILPAPSRIALTAAELIRNGELIEDLGISLARAATGFAIGGTIGFALGTVVGFSRIAAAMGPSIQMIRAIPFLALQPVAIPYQAARKHGPLALVDR
jgi:sulfonate transport system permease protein